MDLLDAQGNPTLERATPAEVVSVSDVLQDALPPPVRILLIGGGAGSGKTALARALADSVPGAALVHLDACYHRDPDLAPSVPRFDGPGRVVDFSNPLALDSARIKAALAEHATAPLVIVEGTFALALPELP
ncbi:zeta toxin family protein [Streptomyces sp. NPDC056492]|uniref:zeta toxin family protein n=1 Tax=unclassified Streptomyces TaxID=2593676 RepID=UPI0036932F4A